VKKLGIYSIYINFQYYNYYNKNLDFQKRSVSCHDFI